jgi:hypothetical protein
MKSGTKTLRFGTYHTLSIHGWWLLQTSDVLFVPSFQTNTCKPPSSGSILRFQGKDSPSRAVGATSIPH